MRIRLNRSELPIYLLLIFISYRALIAEVLFDIQTVVTIIVIIAGAYKFFIKKNYKKFSKMLIYFFLLNAFYVVANGFVFFNQPTFVKGVTHYIIFGLVLFVFVDCWDKVSLLNILIFFSRINLLNAVGSIIESFTSSYILSTSHVQFNDDGRIRTAAFNGDMIVLPILLAVCILIELYLYRLDNKKSHVIVAIFDFIALFVSQSRGPLVACMVAVTLFLILYQNENYSKKIVTKRTLRRTFIISVILLVILFVILKTPLLDNSPLAHFATRIRTIFVWDNSNGDHSNATRVNLWKYFGTMFLNNPWFGIGIGRTGVDLGVTIGATESAILKRLVELGIVGTVINASLFFTIEKNILSNIRSAIGEKRALLILSFCITIVILVEAMILQIDEYFGAISIFWFIASFGARKVKKE